MKEKEGSLELFISFSGRRSEALASWLFRWLEEVVPTVRPYFAGQLMGGESWFDHVRHYMEKADAAVFCVTPDNLDSEWLNFELGLFCASPRSRFAVVVTVGVEPAAIGEGPLRQFQAFPFSREVIQQLFCQLGRNDASRIERSVASRWREMESEAREFL